MRHEVEECDVLVIGGGPAGSTAAQLLASWGRSVTILHRPVAAHLTLAESLPASTRKLLRFLGQLDRVDAAGFYPNTGNRAAWAGEDRVTSSADAGFHVPRAAFDQVLLDGARGAGARVVEARVQRVAGDDPVRVTWRHQRRRPDRTSRALRARLLRPGRRRRPSRSAAESTPPIARSRSSPNGRPSDWPAEERTATTIESYGDGWAWSVPLSATRRQCTVMIDPPSLGTESRASFGETGPPPRAARSGASYGAAGLPALYEQELSKARGLGARLANARQVTAPWTCDASIYDASRAADGRVLLVGDAASFIEPLSSAGVKKALLSAWRAAVVVNTCLDNPAMAEPAIDLFVRRERAVYNDCLRRSAAFFAEASRAYGTPFWAARADAAPACRS